MSRTVMPRAYNAMIRSLNPSSRAGRTRSRSSLGRRGGGAVDQDDGGGGGGGEGFGVEDSGAGRGAIEEQRQLFAELFRVGGAGFAGGFGEPRGEGFLVVACVLACGVLRVVDFDGRRDVGAHWRDVLCPGRGDLEGGEEAFAGRE